jgi:glycine oxidase
MGSRARIAVIGGGITGAFSAYFLARAGAAPILVERDRIGGQASGHNAGGLNPLHGPGIPGPMHELALQSLELHLDQWSEIRALSGIEFGGMRVARIYVATDDGEAQSLGERGALHNQTSGFSARWMTASELRAAEPRLSDEVVGGLWTDGNARVEPRAYTRAVAAAARRLGADLVSASATGLRHHGGHVTGVELDSGSLGCDGVVIATGPWCDEPSRWLAWPLPVEPLKGELLRAAPVAIPNAEMTWREVGLYRASDDTVWLGGTEDQAGFDRTPTGSARERILDGIARLLPGLGKPRIEAQTTGLRPVTPDGLPIAGVPDRWDNVCLALGGGRKGMLLGAGLGMAAAELLTTGTTKVSIDPCSPRRWNGGP